MSEGQKYPLEIARGIAEQLVSAFAEHCERIEVAGSIRRRRPDIGDIEIVAIPIIDRQQALFGDMTGGAEHNRLHTFLDDLMSAQKIHRPPGQQAWGNKYRKFVVPTKQGGRFKVDLFMCMPENWGNVFLIRTGSRDFSRFMVTTNNVPYRGDVMGALPPGYTHDKGRLHQFVKGNWIPLIVPEEQDWFNLCGLPYIEPQHRQDDKWLEFTEEQSIDGDDFAELADELGGVITDNYHPDN